MLPFLSTKIHKNYLYISSIYKTYLFLARKQLNKARNSRNCQALIHYMINMFT